MQASPGLQASQPEGREGAGLFPDVHPGHTATLGPRRTQGTVGTGCGPGGLWVLTHMTSNLGKVQRQQGGGLLLLPFPPRHSRGLHSPQLHPPRTAPRFYIKSHSGSGSPWRRGWGSGLGHTGGSNHMEAHWSCRNGAAGHRQCTWLAASCKAAAVCSSSHNSRLHSAGWSDQRPQGPGLRLSFLGRPGQQAAVLRLQMHDWTTSTAQSLPISLKPRLLLSNALAPSHIRLFHHTHPGLLPRLVLSAQQQHCRWTNPEEALPPRWTAQPAV